MKNLALIFIATVSILAFSCRKTDKTTERFRLLTTVVWASDSLLANGVDASQPGGMLVNLKGDARFKEDGTGTFGDYTGTWRFNSDETKLTITSSALIIPMITTDVKELTATSLKITTSFTNPLAPGTPVNIRMTFKAK